MCATEPCAGWVCAEGRHGLRLTLALVITSSAGAAPVAPPTASSDLRPALKAAARDPFLMPVAPTPAPPLAPPVLPFVPPTAVLAAPAMPSEPVLQLSFAGRLQTPDGRMLVLAQWGDGRPVLLEQGKTLGNGYRVERMSAGMVELLNPQTQAVVQLPLPPAPRFETR